MTDIHYDATYYLVSLYYNCAEKHNPTSKHTLMMDFDTKLQEHTFPSLKQLKAFPSLQSLFAVNKNREFNKEQQEVLSKIWADVEGSRPQDATITLKDFSNVSMMRVFGLAHQLNNEAAYFSAYNLIRRTFDTWEHALLTAQSVYFTHRTDKKKIK